MSRNFNNKICYPINQNALQNFLQKYQCSSDIAINKQCQDKSLSDIIGNTHLG